MSVLKLCNITAYWNHFMHPLTYAFKLLIFLVIRSSGVIQLHGSPERSRWPAKQSTPEKHTASYGTEHMKQSSALHASAQSWMMTFRA